MDGTLINSGAIISNTINHVRINCGLEPMPQELLLTNINNPHIDPAQFFYETNEFTPKHSQLFEEYYDKHCINSIELYDGIEELLKELEKLNYTMSIATNASNEFARKAIGHLGISKYFSFVVGYDDVKKPKPDPQMLNITMDSLKFSNRKSMLIGDSHKDLLAAQKANIDCHLVNWGFTDHGDDGYANTIDLLNTIVS